MFGVVQWELGKRINAIRHNPNKKLTALMPQLLKMKGGIGDAATVSEPLEGIVDFFNVVNPVFDNIDQITEVIDAFDAANYGDRYKKVIENLTLLRTHVRNGGRNRSGWNRTKAGEVTTAHTVFLGDIWGLFTHPAYFWMTCDPNDPTKCGNGLTAIETVRLQAKNFMQSHLSMIEIIEDLRKESQQG